MKYCSTCHRPFTPKRDYYHQCYRCWQHAHSTTPADQWRLGYLAGHEAGYAAGRANAAPLDPDFVIRVIKLCHPDKHPPERFAEANQITAQLLALREGSARS